MTADLPADQDPPPDGPALPPPLAARRPRRTGAPWLVVVLSIVFGLLCLATAAAVLVTERSGSGEEAVSEQVGELVAERASALEAARERTVAITSYDHRTLDADVQGVLATATGEFETEYTETVQSLRETFVQTQAVATGTVVAAGLEGEVVDSEQGERAVVVVAVDQVISTTGAAPRTERNRLRMQLVRPEDTWLVAGVERL